jgi:hypothetical protein
VTVTALRAWIDGGGATKLQGHAIVSGSRTLAAPRE